MNEILTISAGWVYVVVGLMIFAEDALFIGFVIPGETAAVLAGVAASQQTASLPIVLAVVVAAAIVGDSVGYRIGARYGPTILALQMVRNRQDKVDRAQALLVERGGWAVFFGRFVAFFRAVVPTMAGISHMPYRSFLTFNVLGGVVWGTVFVLVGYLAGSSYSAASDAVGRDVVLVVVVAAAVLFVGWRVRVFHRQRSR